MASQASKKIILGLFSALPSIYTFVVMLSVGCFIEYFGCVIYYLLPLLLFFHLIAMLMTFALVIYYVIMAARCDKLSNSRRILWISSLLIFNVFTLPFAYYFFIFKSQEGSKKPDAGDDGSNRGLTPSFDSQQIENKEAK